MKLGAQKPEVKKKRGNSCANHGAHALNNSNTEPKINATYCHYFLNTYTVAN